MIQDFRINSEFNTIAGLMTIPNGPGRYPCVILSHGLISSKESSKYVALSERFTGAGIATCRFDYHGCGASGGNIEDTTLSIRIENLNEVAEYVLKHGQVKPESIGIVGSSFGATTALIKAARDKRIQCVSLWATPYTLEKQGDGSISEIAFKENIYDDFAKYDILSEAKKVSSALVVHGEVDEVVPCQEGKAIYRNIRKPKSIEIIKGADHIFSNPAHREKAITLTLNWFRRYLPSV